VTVQPAVTIPSGELAALCRRWHISWLALFGSVLTTDFRLDSDVDLLVEFEPGPTPGLRIIDLEEELGRLFGGRKVHLVSRKYLNRWIRDRVLAQAQVLYAKG